MAIRPKVKQRFVKFLIIKMNKIEYKGPAFPPLKSQKTAGIQDARRIQIFLQNTLS